MLCVSNQLTDLPVGLCLEHRCWVGGGCCSVSNTDAIVSSSDTEKAEKQALEPTKEIKICMSCAGGHFDDVY